MSRRRVLLMNRKRTMQNPSKEQKTKMLMQDEKEDAVDDGLFCPECPRRSAGGRRGKGNVMLLR